MDESFYGFQEPPFARTPDLRYLLLTAHSRDALAALEYGLSIGGGLTLLAGEPGTGKTLLLARALAPYGDGRSFPPPRCAIVHGTALLAGAPAGTGVPHARRMLVSAIARGFQLGGGVLHSTESLLAALASSLVPDAQDGIGGRLIIDEAHCLPDDLLEDVSRLARVAWRGETLLRVVLAGHPSLLHRLNEPGLCRVKPCIGLRGMLRPLTARETAMYIAHRIAVAGGTPANVFTHGAVAAIHEASRGVPAAVNVVCDRALAAGAAWCRRPIGPEVIAEVAGESEAASGTAAPAFAGDPSPIDRVPRSTHIRFVSVPRPDHDVARHLARTP